MSFGSNLKPAPINTGLNNYSGWESKNRSRKQNFLAVCLLGSLNRISYVYCSCTHYCFNEVCFFYMYFQTLINTLKTRRMPYHLEIYPPKLDFMPKNLIFLL